MPLSSRNFHERLCFPAVAVWPAGRLWPRQGSDRGPGRTETNRRVCPQRRAFWSRRWHRLACSTKPPRQVTAWTLSAALNGRRAGRRGAEHGRAGKRGYIVVNGSNKVEVVSLPDFKSAGVISGPEQPRYFLSISQAGLRDASGGMYSRPHRYAGHAQRDRPEHQRGESTACHGPQRPSALAWPAARYSCPTAGSNTVTRHRPRHRPRHQHHYRGRWPSSMLRRQRRQYLGAVRGLRELYASRPDYAATSPGKLVRFRPSNPATPDHSVPLPATASPSDMRINPAGDQLFYRFAGADTSWAPLPRHCPPLAVSSGALLAAVPSTRATTRCTAPSHRHGHQRPLHSLPVQRHDHRLVAVKWGPMASCSSKGFSAYLRFCITHH